MRRVVLFSIPLLSVSLTSQAAVDLSGPFADDTPFETVPLLQFDPQVSLIRDDFIVIRGVSVVPEASTCGLIGMVTLFGLLRRKR